MAVGGDERVAVGVTERRVRRQVDEHLEILILQSIAEWKTWPLSYEQFTGFLFLKNLFLTSPGKLNLKRRQF